MDLFRALHAQGTTIVVVTHDPEVARHALRTISIVDGLITSDAASTSVISQ